MMKIRGATLSLEFFRYENGTTFFYKAETTQLHKYILSPKILCRAQHWKIPNGSTLNNYTM